MGLPSQHNRAVDALHHQRLVPVHVSRRGDHVDAGTDLGLPVQQFVGTAGEVHEVVHRVVPSSCHREFFPLTHDRATSQHRVAAAMIEVQMAVHHQLDLVQRNADGAKRFRQDDPLRAVPVLRFVITLAEAGVQQHKTEVVSNQIAVHGLDSWTPISSLLRRSHERSEQEAPNVVGTHFSTVAAPPRPCSTLDAVLAAEFLPGVDQGTSGRTTHLDTVEDRAPIAMRDQRAPPAFRAATTTGASIRAPPRKDLHMATDYDASRKTEDEQKEESLEARRLTSGEQDKTSGKVDEDETELAESYGSPARISPTKRSPSKSRRSRPTSSRAQPVSSFSTNLDGPHRPPTSVATAPDDRRVISGRGWLFEVVEAPTGTV